MKPEPQKLGVTEAHLEIEDAAEPNDGDMSVDAALEVIGFGRFQAMTMVICGIAWSVDAVEIGGMPYVYVTLDREWGTTTADWGLLNSLKSMASVVGALTFGVVADRFGRRPAFLGALTLTSIAGIATAAASDFQHLLMLRCATNIGGGGLLPVGISLLAEHLPPSCRETCVVFMQIFFVAGQVMAVLISMLFIPTGKWRMFLLALAGAPTMLLMAIARLLPESPVFLVQSGQSTAAKEALSRMCRFNGRPDWNARVTQDASLAAEDAECSQQSKRGLGLILSRWGLATRALVFGFLWAFAMTGSDWKSWVTELGNKHNSPEHSVAMFMILINFVGIIGFLSAAWLARGGRGPSVLRGALVAATGFALLSAFLIEDHISLPFICSVIGLALSYDMVWSLLYATTAAAFDPLCRASAISVASSFSRAAASVAPLLSGFLLQQEESVALFFWAAAWACAALLALLINFSEVKAA